MDKPGSDRRGGGTPETARAARLKAALRANLNRRKAQQRARTGEAPGSGADRAAEDGQAAPPVEGEQQAGRPPHPDGGPDRKA